MSNQIAPFKLSATDEQLEDLKRALGRDTIHQARLPQRVR
jgi:hypothetical protein